VNFRLFREISCLLLTMFITCQSRSQTSLARDSLPVHLKLYNEGVKLIDSGKFEQAIPFFKKSLKERKDFWEAFNRMAYAKIKLKDFKSAAKDLEKSDKVSPFNYETYKLQGINFYLDNKYNESKKILDSAFYYHELDQMEDAELLYYRASLMFKGKKPKEALGVCETALEFKPGYMEVFMLKAQIRFNSREYNYAIRELDQAIELMTLLNTDYLAYKLRAKSRFEIGDFKGAVSDWNVYIDAIPKEEEALVSRAAAKINVDDNSGAIADLDDAIKLNPTNPVSYCYRGVAKGGNKSYIEAVKDLDYSIKLKFNYPAAYVNRAAIKMAVKDKRGACEDLEKADRLGDEMAYRLIETYCKNR
jgi:tetratricopeptide (TPR) repeat protein